jgi:hypothetical protein
LGRRRSLYTREDAARICGRSLRTIIRWEEEGLLTRLYDPSDPSGRRVRYAGAEVDALARRQRRLANDDALDQEPSSGVVPPERGSSRPRVPRPRRPPPRHLNPPRPALIQARPPQKPRPTAAAKGPARRLVTPEAATPPAPVKEPDMVSHAPFANDKEAEEWLREIDERKRAWEAAEADNTKADDAPPSSAKRR